MSSDHAPTLVTGATGLLGQWVVRTLCARATPVVCLRYDPDLVGDWARIPMESGATYVSGDVRDGELLADLLFEHKIEVVHHLAAQAIVSDAAEDPATTFDINARGTWTLLDACRRVGGLRALVVASSDKAYGDAGGRPYTEDMPLQPTNPYDVSKGCADLIARSYATAYDLPVVVTRCGNLYGGGDLNWSRLVPGTIRSALAGERPVIRSDGRYVRDYLYVDDAADGYVRLAEALVDGKLAPASAFNLASGDGVNALALAERVVALIGAELECEVRDEATGEIREQRLDATRARTTIEWRATTSLDDGLRQAIDWYGRFLHAEREHTSPR